MLFFNDVEVKVDGTGLMVERISLNSTAPVSAARTIGRNLSHQTPNGFFRTNAQFSYYIDLEKDPLYARVLDLKNTTNYTGLLGQTVEVAGVTGVFYLQRYQLAIGPNQILRASVAMAGYEPSTGELQKKTSSTDYLPVGFSGLAHSWTTKAITDAGDLTLPIYDFSYKFSPVYNPIYTLCKKFPNQVTFLSSEEDITLTQDTYRATVFTGESGFNAFGDSANPRIKVLKLGSLCDASLDTAMEIDVSRAVLDSANLNVDSNSYAQVLFHTKRYN